MEIKHRADIYKIIDISLPTAELGCAEGLFSRDILNWGVPKHYLVDTWATIQGQRGDGGNDQGWHDANLDNVKKLVKPFGNKAVILRGFSVDMAARVENVSLGFVNVDCDHSYEGVKADISAWWPKLKTGGVMAFHDYEMPHYGVKQAVTEFAQANGLEIHLLPEREPKDAGAYLIKK